MLNLLLIVLQPVPSLYDYKVWINTQRDEKVKHHFRNMVQLNMMEEEFCARRLEEHRHAAYFAMQHEMDHEEYKEKRGEERAQKCEKAQRAKEMYARGGEKVLIKDKWPRLTQD
jgi:hypothetical protein